MPVSKGFYTTDDKEILLNKMKEIIDVSDDVRKMLERNHLFEEDTDTVTAMQADLLKGDRFKGGMIKIICYGRSGYGALVEKGQNKDISFDIIICGSESVKKFGKGIEGAEDIETITAQVKSWLRDSEKGSKKITIHASIVPPVIRASVFYDKDKKPQWGTMQSYQFIVAPAEEEPNKNKLYIAKPAQDLITVCDINKCTSHDFQMLISCFDLEFERLKKNSIEVRIENSKVIF